MKLRSVLPMRVAKYGCILISLLFCYTGVRMTLHATPFGMEFYLFFGIAMMLFAVVKLIGYFSKDLFRLAFQYDLQLGILLGLLGALTLIKRRSGVEFVCTTYAVSVIADCLFKIRTALDAKRFGIRQWWLTFALAIVAGSLGVLVMLDPFIDVQTVPIMLGISLVTVGLLNLSVALSMVKIVRHQKPDQMDRETCETWEET